MSKAVPSVDIGHQFCEATVTAEFNELKQILAAENEPSDLSIGLAKVFTFDERFKLRVEASFTNVTNHTNLNENSLNLNLGSASFGVITSGLGGRSAQIAARMDF